MPKDRRVNSSSSFDQAMVSPYSCSSNISDHNKCDSSLLHVGDEREWEEARCPICMEHPHNAILLLCSSREKGCRPFICDTSYRHSNCLDQFRKAAAVLSLQTTPEQQPELVCPLCRGLITGRDVIQPARKFMNSKIRSCSLETCSFSGNYSELRKHARLEHPSERPAEASSTRQSNWMVLEQQREMEDALAHQSDIEYDLDGLPSWEEWSENDLWSDGSFFDFPSGMSDIEDEWIDEMFSGLSFSFFSLYSSTLEEEMMDSGSSRSSDLPERTPLLTNSGSRSTNRVGNALPSSRPRSSYYSENGATSSGHRSEDDATIARSTSVYQRENNAANLRSRSNHPGIGSSENPANLRENSSNISSPRLTYLRENAATRLRTGSSENPATVSRSYHHRENAATRLRTGSSENPAIVSRSYHRRENGATSSRTRSSDHRENHQPSSRPILRYHPRELTPPVRRSSARHLPGSSRQP